MHMVIWGAVWGAIVGYLTSQYDAEFAGFVGAILGAFAGLTLRHAVRTEIAKRLAQGQPALPVQAAVARYEVPSAVSDHAAPLPAQPMQPVEHLERQTASDVPQAPSTEAEDSDFFEPTPSSTPPSKPLPPPTLAPLPPKAATRQEPPQLDPISRALQAGIAWFFGGNTIVRMGVLVLFVGLAFLAKYAMDNALLPPELRLAAIAATGVGLLVFGFRLRNRQPERLTYALSLQGAGVAVLYLTVFAAFRLYQFVPAGAAFVLLALVCALSTTIALLQNAMPMAFIGFAGAFATPLLVSTGQGNHVGLFSYYLLLGTAIMVVAWWRAWRALNLLGFFATFGVATLWGVLKYQPELLASTEPFLVGFFVLYLVASVLYATRHGLQPRQAVDATLIFGLPIVAMGLQAALVHPVEYAMAFSSLVLGAVYLALGWWAVRRQAHASTGAPGVGVWLAECFAALGLGFVTLAVPLALDGRWTAAVWAAEGLGVYWLGMRQDRWLARCAGLALQVLAALSFVNTLHQGYAQGLPVLNAAFVGAVLLAVCALLLGHWARREAQPAGSAWAQQVLQLEKTLSPVLFWVGFLWWQLALGYEIGRVQVAADGLWQPVFSPALQGHLQLLAWLGSAWLAHCWALPTRVQPWSIAATPAWFGLPLMALCALNGVVQLEHVFQAWGWLVWPLALGLHLRTLKALDGTAPQRLWSWVHSGGVWLLVLLLGNLLVWAVQQAQLHHSAWASVVLLVASVVVLLGLAQPALYVVAGRWRSHWPLRSFAPAYLWRAAWPLAVAVALAALAVAVHSDGNAHPLPYVPVLNPVDLSVALALGVCVLWRLRVCRSDLATPAWLHDQRWTVVLALMAFIVINTMWLRLAHQMAGVPWQADALFASFLVQAGYSILWTLLALALMVWAHRRAERPVWMGGAALLGLTVAKLFLVDLSNRGGSERIVAFIAVGVMMLVVGYFAPLPPPKAQPPLKSDTDTNTDTPTQTNTHTNTEKEFV